MNIKFVSTNTNGDFYVGYLKKVLRGIRGKKNEKQYVDEVLIVGIPKSKMQEFCIKHNLVVEVSSITGKVLRWYERKS